MSGYRRGNEASNSTKKQPSGRVNKYHGMFVGIVKGNKDVQRMGRLQVWIPEFGSAQDDENGWRLVNYCSPFAGATPIDNGKKTPDELNNYDHTQSAYGMWMVSPDLDTQVAIMFSNGDPARGYWFGCIPQQFMNHGIPGNSGSSNYVHPDPAFPKGKTVPVGEYNKHGKTTVSDNIARPVNHHMNSGIADQGLINDKIRGTNTASARREAPSQVYGISTPGPKTKPDDPNNKHRLGGSSFVMDDGIGTENITFRTRSGSQIKIDETNGLIYFINRKGTAWIQLDEEGNIDIFAAKDISMRAQQDFNIRADRNINIEAGQNVNIKAAKDTDASLNIVGEDAGIGGDIIIEALNDIHKTANQNLFVTVTNGNMNLNIEAGNNNEHIAGNKDVLIDGTLTQQSSTLGVSSSNYTLDTGGNIGNSGQVVSAGIHFAPDFQAPGIGLVAHTHPYTMHISGTGLVPAVSSPSTVGGGGSSASGPSAASATSAIKKPKVAATNVLVDFSDTYKFNRKTQDIQTTIDRVPTFEPSPIHTKKGN